MYHIDEGLYILKRIEASELAMRAYAIHPILQGDDNLAAFWASDQVRPTSQERRERCSRPLNKTNKINKLCVQHMLFDSE